MNIPDKLLPPKKRTYAFAFSDQSDGGLKAEKSSTPAVSMIIKPIHDDNLLLPPKKRRYTASAFSTTVQETRVVDQPRKPSTLAFSMIKPIHNNNNNLLLLPPNKPIYAIPLAFIANNQLTLVDQPDYTKRPRRLDDGVNNNNGLLESLRQHVKNNNMDFKDISDVQILMDKQLTMSDFKDSQARLSLPKKQIEPVVFLTRDEDAFLEKKVGVNKNNHIDVKVIMGSSVYNMHLSRWNYASKSGKGSWRYVLQHNWNKLKSDNKLQVDDIIRVVSFRSKNRINFAILGPKRSFSLFGTRVEAFPWY